MLPETILQFGAGNFLRAFVDLFVQQANDDSQQIGRIVVVQSTDSGRAAALTGAGAKYHVLMRGKWQGKVLDDVLPVSSVSRALAAKTDWPVVLAVAASPDLKYVVSNVTEAGFSLAEGDRADASPPVSFPAKLTAVLHHRWRESLNGLTILPCELIEGNGKKLLDLCLEQAGRWSLPQPFTAWMSGACVWRNSLVDRIVSGKPAEHPLLATDPLLTACEPFALWAIEAPDPADPTRPDPAAAPLRHPAVQVVADVKPYSLRKIRVLNGAHTALVCRALPMGIRTVREAIEHPDVGPWLRDLLFEEIVPVLESRVDSPRLFAEQTLERFANPFLEHKLADIALNHAAKLKTRLVPTYEDYVEKFGKPPLRLEAVLREQGLV